MTTKAISALAATNTVDATTVAPVVYSGTTYKATLTTLGAFITTNAVTVSASGNITASGNVQGNYILGNGALLTGVITSVANINSGTSNVTVVSSGGNITVGVGGTSNVAVFDTTGEYVTGVVSASGNITGGNLITAAAISAASVSASGNITGGNILGGANVNATTHTGTTVSVSGNITGGNLNAAGLSLSSNVVSALNVTGAIAGANLTTPGLISATGNITGGNLITSAAISAASVSATGNITGGNILGGANVNATTHTGTTVSVSGNITGGNVNVGNITIATDLISSLGTTLTIDPATVGNAGLVVINGNLQVNGTTTTINSNVVSTNDLTVNYANNAINAAAANGGGIEVGPIGSPFITWLYNNTANVFTSSGGISAVGNITGGNLNAAGLSLSSNVVSALNVTGAIAGANVTTPGLISATGNITGGNVLGGANVNATTHTGATVSVTGNITGGNVLGGANVNATTHTGATVSVTGNITGGNLIISGSISDSGQLDISTTASNGNIVLTPNGTGNVNISSNIIPTSSNATANIGSATASFNTVFAKATSAQYADLAEKYTADAEYTPGTVLSFGGSQEVTLSLIDADHRVAGVVSTNSAYIMNAGLTSEHVATVALTGRVPCSVTGTVRKGDSMVSAGNGAARVEANPTISTVIGKALEDFDGESGVIEVVVGRV